MLRAPSGASGDYQITVIASDGTTASTPSPSPSTSWPTARSPADRRKPTPGRFQRPSGITFNQTVSGLGNTLTNRNTFANLSFTVTGATPAIW